MSRLFKWQLYRHSGSKRPIPKKEWWEGNPNAVAILYSESAAWNTDDAAVLSVVDQPTIREIQSDVDAMRVPCFVYVYRDAGERLENERLVGHFTPRRRETT